MKGNLSMSRTQDQIDQPSSPAYAGVDVGKDSLDLCIPSAGCRITLDNTARGVRELVRLCARHRVRLVALEATGKYHRLAHDKLHASGVPVAVVNPFRSRQFADSMGVLAKTDTIDAKLLAQFAERIQPAPTIPQPAQRLALRELTAARRQIVQQIGDLKRQLHSAHHPLTAKQMRARLRMAERHKAVLEDEIQTLIQAQEDLKRKFHILTSIPHVGAVTAAILVSELTELGQVNCKQIAALAGVAPMSWDSGAKQGARMIRGGRKTVRNALYMCAVSCAGRRGSLGKFYRHLIKAGKTPKVALTAVMRKLVILANTLIGEDRCWRPVSP